MSRFPSQKAWALILLAVLVYFPLFLHLDSFPVYQWDESRFANNAFEMSQNGNILVTHYEGEPDMWNSKPSLLVASQAFFMKILGYHELSLRLPISLACLFTLLCLWLFAKKVLKVSAIGYLAVLCLVCSLGYIRLHIARSGDADALLIAGITLYSLSYFAFLEDKKPRWWILIGLGIIIGIYSKGVAALIPLPGILLYTLFTKNISKVFLSRAFYFSAAGVVLATAAYYLGREALNPGYLKVVAANELGGRFFRDGLSKEAVNYDYLFYLKSIWKRPNHPFLWLVPFLAMAGLFSPRKILQRLTGFCLLFILAHLCLISLASTKHHWYDGPNYPILALLSGVGLYAIFERLPENISILWQRVIGLLAICALFAYPYMKVIQHVTHDWQISHWEAEGKLMQQIHEQVQDVGEYTVLKKVDHPFHYAQIHYYRKVYKLEGKDIQVSDTVNFQPGDKVLCCQAPFIQELESRYRLTNLTGWRDCRLFQIEAEYDVGASIDNLEE